MRTLPNPEQACYIFLVATHIQVATLYLSCYPPRILTLY